MRGIEFSIGMCCHVIQEMLASFHDIFGGSGLQCREFVEGYWDGGVGGAAVIKETTDDLL
jgi:hypothetical protein